MGFKKPKTNAGGSIRKYLKEKLIVNKELIGYNAEKKQLLSILRRTVQDGESDSVLVIGPPGSGKRTLVAACINDLETEYMDDKIVVFLNGLIHTDDNLALREIIQQLHIDELNGIRISGSFSENLLFVLQSLGTGERDSTKPIIFILEEFQLFCDHRNQTLLYNLFDVTQTAKAPVCVVGLTCRVDITELLEKRVKSRFSHRQIMLLPSNRLKDRLDKFIFYLSLPEKLISGVSSNIIQNWNESIKTIIKDSRTVQCLRRQLEIDCNEKKFKSVLFLLVCEIDGDAPALTVETVEKVYHNYFEDTKVELLKDLSVLELCLVIAVSQQSEIYDKEPFNFEMICGRYLKFAHQYGIQITQTPILLKAFERIKDLELILPVSGSSRSSKKEYQLYSFVVTKGQLGEAVVKYSGLPTEVIQWASTCPT